MFKSMKERLNELLDDMIQNFGDAAFEALDMFLFDTTDLGKYEFLNQMHGWLTGFTITISIMFFTYNMLKIMFAGIMGQNSRSVGELTFKTAMGLAFASFSPYLLTEILLKINNLYVEWVISKGVNTDTMQKYLDIDDPLAVSFSMMLTVFFLMVLYLILAVQYLIRTGQILVVYIAAPFVATTMVNEEMNLWPIFWRETCSIIFMQAFQITILWIIFNMLGGAKSIFDYFGVISLMVILIMGPAALRRILYSTGAGSMAVGAAGGVAKHTMMKYATRKLIG